MIKKFSEMLNEGTLKLDKEFQNRNDSTELTITRGQLAMLLKYSLLAAKGKVGDLEFNKLLGDIVTNLKNIDVTDKANLLLLIQKTFIQSIK